MNFIKGLKAFFKVGAIGFGGGTALIPVIEREIIEKNNLITKEEFASDMVIQGITPGAFPIKSATSLGISFNSGGQAVALAYATSCVGAILAIIFSVILSVLSPSALSWVEYIGVGISAFVIVIIGKFVIKVPKEAYKNKTLIFCALLMLFAIFFSFGSRLEQFISLFTHSAVNLHLPELSTVTILLLGLNFVFITNLQLKLSVNVIIRYIFAITLTVLAVLCMAKSPVISAQWLKYTVYALITISISVALALDFIKARKTAKADNAAQPSERRLKKTITTPLIAIGISLVPFILIGGASAFLTAMPFGEFMSYVGNSILSVITTFGGGTAYISVAEGMFITSGALPSSLFWSQIVPISNALPGPLLVKMLAGIWYNLSMISGAGMAVNILMSVFGVVLGITTTVTLFLLVYMLYRSLSSLSIFAQIKMAILPLIAGLLIPTVMSMFNNMIKVSMTCSINVWYSSLITLLLISSCCLLSIKFKVKDPYLLLIFGGSSTVILGCLSIFL